MSYRIYFVGVLNIGEKLNKSPIAKIKSSPINLPVRYIYLKHTIVYSDNKINNCNNTIKGTGNILVFFSAIYIYIIHNYYYYIYIMLMHS